VPRSSIQALTLERAKAILAAIAGDRLEAAYALAFVGLRSSEILGLARSDLDLDNATVTIRHQVAGSGRKAVLVATKTATSAATIPLPPFVVERLRLHLERLDAARPVVPFGDSLVFVTWWRADDQRLVVHEALPGTAAPGASPDHASPRHAARGGKPARRRGCPPSDCPGAAPPRPRQPSHDGAYAHVTAGQQRLAAELLERAVTGGAESVTESVTVSIGGVARSSPQEPGMVDPLGESGSGGRTRTYDQAVNSRPLYH
jgi:hypothetical protein